MVEGAVFIGAVIAGVTRAIKLLAPESVQGIVTVIVAVVVGIVVALLDTQIGVVNISVAQGIMIALGTVGVVNVVEKV